MLRIAQSTLTSESCEVNIILDLSMPEAKCHYCWELSLILNSDAGMETLRFLAMGDKQPMWKQAQSPIGTCEICEMTLPVSCALVESPCSTVAVTTKSNFKK